MYGVCNTPKVDAPLKILACTLPAWPVPDVAIAASRAHAVGILNLEFVADERTARAAVRKLVQYGRGQIGIKLDASALEVCGSLAREELPAALTHVILTATPAASDLVRCLQAGGRTVLWESTSLEEAQAGAELGVDGLIAKGNETGGRVGEETTFILLQRLLAQFQLPVWAHGGIGIHSAAAANVAGAAGIVLDDQLALANECLLPDDVRAAIERMEGDETVYLGATLGDTYRIYKRPGFAAVDELQRLERELDGDPAKEDALLRWRQTIRSRMRWGEPATSLWPLGQDAVFAARLAQRFQNVAGILNSVRDAIDDHVRTTRAQRPLARNSPLARSHGTEYPILQGPMTRVSDSAAFAGEVAQAGALPFLALALLRGPQVRELLRETQQRLGERPWGVGILGFVPPELREEQLDIVREFHPRFALIAGGRPDQAVALEQAGTATYLHVPAPGLLRAFLEAGARRFVFEGRECGGHVGPRSSLVLWDTMVDVLLDAVERGVSADELHLVFAGGIHDARSAAMAAAIAAPLTAHDARFGVLLGTAYLFTEEAVRTGAIVPGFQREAIACARTSLLESGPGHATRCADTPFVQTFRDVRRRLLSAGKSPDDVKAELEDLNLGRLRIASKAITRSTQHAQQPGTSRYVSVSHEQQRVEGMFMLGQLAALRDSPCAMAALNEDIAAGGTRWLDGLAVVHRSRPAAAARPSDIAIIGMGCLLPGAQDVRRFWHNIVNKVNAVGEIPQDRFDVNLYFDPDRKARDKIYSKWGGFLADIPFDPTRYGIPPSAVPSIDPLQLLTLEVVQQALADAGYATRMFPRERSSIILGASGGLGDLGMQYGFRALQPMYAQEGAVASPRLPEWTEDSFAGVLLNVAAGRAANRFDLGGVNFTVDAACASSLAAVYLAGRELERGESDMVIAGGIDTVQTPFGYLCFSKTQALSPQGRCRAFDASADGIAISEGLTVVVLKRLADAERDGDRIYAVIKGISGSSDGRDRSLTAPRPEGQMLALGRAYAQAGISAASIRLVEAHGTGTVVGDASEVASLTQVYQAAGAAARSCAIGSVKSMIGHTKSAAGTAGLIKIALALYHKILPPTLHVKEPNPKIQDSPFFVNTEPLPWMQEVGDIPRRAAVSAFGFGGTNFHAVLEEYTGDFGDPLRSATADWSSELFVWHAATSEALQAPLEALERVLDHGAQPLLRDLAAGVCRQKSWQTPSQEGRVLAIIASSLEDLRAKLSTVQQALHAGRDGFQDPKGIYLRKQAGGKGKLAFLFPGQGSQYPYMLRDLALHFPEIRQSLQLADQVLAGKLPQRLSSFIFPPPPFTTQARTEQRQELTDTSVAQPALGAVEVGLLRLLTRLGVQPDMTAGHSYGEYAALCAAGVFSEETLFEVSEARGRAIKESLGEAPGAMVAVEADAEAIARSLPDTGQVWLANFNSHRQTVLAGRPEELEQALRALQAEGLHGRRLPVACAFHSPLMESARERLEIELSRIHYASPRLAVFSNSLATLYPSEPAAIRKLLARHLVSPVQFAHEIEAMYAHGARIFLEVGPSGVLTGLTQQILAEKDALAVAVDVAGRNGLVQLLHAVAQLVVHGVPCELQALFRGRISRELDPTRLEQEIGTAIGPTTWFVNGGQARPSVRSRKTQEALMQNRENITPETRSGESADQKPTAAPCEAIAPGAYAEPHASKVSDVPTAESPSSSPSGAAPADGIGLPAQLSGADQVMLNFQNLMSQLLQTQSAVMTAYLNGAAPPEAGAFSAVISPAASSPGDSSQAAGALTPQGTAPLSPQPVSAAGLGRAAQHPVRADEKHQAPPPSPQVTPPRDIAQRLLDIVSERTGYAPEMLDADMNLEADLGIDSIKRVEIFTRFQRQCSPDEQRLVQGVVDKLTSLKTLREITTQLSTALAQGSKPAPGAGPANEDRTQVVPQEPGAPPPVHEVPRFMLEVVDIAPGLPAKAPGTDRVWLITDDERGIAAGLSQELEAAGARAVLVRHRAAKRVVQTKTGVYSADLTDPKSVAALLETIRQRRGAIGAFLHLLPLKPMRDYWELSLSEWQARVRQDIKSLYLFARGTEPDLAKAGQSRGLFAAVTGMGGLFATEPVQVAAPTHAGVAAFIRTLTLEWPNVPCKAIDLDPAESSSVLCDKVLNEIRADDTVVQVGRPGTRRVTPISRYAPLGGDDERGVWNITSDSVFLVTGGARGITAEIATHLARRYRPNLILVGRSPLPDPEEPPGTAGVTDPQRVKAAIAADLGHDGKAVRAAEVETAYRALQQAREIRRTIDAITDSGARVEYHQVDVRDEDAFGGLIDEIYRRHGRLDGVIHGAGVIEDKLIADKSPDSFDRVLHTKVDGAFVLSRKLRPQGLKAMVFMASVTATFGNRGQSDYAAANGVLNALSALLAKRWPGRVTAMNWGPWDKLGMVSEEVRTQFLSRGIQLIPPPAGSEALVSELVASNQAGHVLVFGDGPWFEKPAQRVALEGIA